MHNRTQPTPHWLLLAAATLAAGTAPAQGVRAMAPVAATVPVTQANDDAGAPVEMFENANLDRYLRRAQAFLDRDDFAAAIEVLQDVVEGRTTEVIGGSETAAPPDSPAPPAKPAKAGASPATGERRPLSDQLDARRAVFSIDGRLYRPVRRLCHELLAHLPPIGIELYRAAHEVRAQEMLDRAVADGSIGALDEVANRYFVTLPAGRAMAMLADRLMHEGRYRAAVQVLRDLVEIYPESSRQRLGISVVWCRFKIALCLSYAGEPAAAREQVQLLAESHHDETLRILGELQAVSDMPGGVMFAGASPLRTPVRDEVAGPTWLTPSADPLIPMWQFRFANPEPYREPKPGQNERNLIFEEGLLTYAMPHAARYGAGTWVALGPPAAAMDATAPRASFFEHQRVRIADAATGLVIAETDGSVEPPVARDNHPRVRIAAADFALLRPVEDERRRYVVHGHVGHTSSSTTVLKASELRAYARDSMQRVWSSAQWLEGEDGLADVTFLAAPTLFGERLLLPALRRGAYSLECIDRASGRPLWHTMLHAGGTHFFKAPGAPVAVQGGIAYVATNAGCLAAVDAFAGDLRWIRRYERTDPLRAPSRPPTSRRDEVRHGYFAQEELPGFVPSDIVVHGGLVIVAPCDGDVLLCVDGASGAPVWMFDASTRYAAPFGRMRRIVGTAGDDLFVLADRGLVCIAMQGGLVRWSHELPQSPVKCGDRGAGVIVGDRIVVPWDRELLVFDARGRGAMQRLMLPAFGDSREPLPGSFHVISHGPWLAIGYAGGVEFFSSAPALRALAEATTDMQRRASFLVLAGDARAAEQTLASALQAGGEPTVRAAMARQLLALVEERAVALLHEADAAAGLAATDPIRDLIDSTSLLDWHLVRLQLCKRAGDMKAYEREQQRLYDHMEGRP